MKVFTSKLCTTLHTPAFEFHGGAQSQHYECPERREAILKYLESHSDSFEVTEHVEDFGYEPIKRVHKQGFLDYLERAYDEWILEGGHPNGVMPSTIPHYKLARLGGQTPTNSLTNAGEYCFDMSAVITKDTFKAAWNAAQVTLTATKDLVRVADEYEKSLAAGTIVSRETPPGLYALVRPPGHHAQSDLCGGYCFLNNVGIAAQWLIDRPELRRKDGKPKKVAIIDIDFHQGEGEGLGFNINVPLPRSTSDDEYVEALEKLIQEHVIPFDSDYIIVSLGVDTFKDDPIAGFLVTSEAYPRIGNAIRKIGLPTLFVQEGGYCVEKLGLNVGGILQGFLGNVAA
ncbi:hypothetical protein BGW39_004483 [Mortierella sp. 14UC]|nr:hypothetical protein BGW39_004483 [Mortierella sp. 14UC]